MHITPTWLKRTGRKDLKMDKEHLQYMLKEINAHKGIPFQMSNEEIADEMFPFIKEYFPDALLVKHDIDQYIVVTTRGKNVLIKQLESRKKKHLQEIESIDYILCVLRAKKKLIATPITMSL